MEQALELGCPTVKFFPASAAGGSWLTDRSLAGVYAVPYPLTDDELPRLDVLAEAPARHGLSLAAIYANVDLAHPAESPEGRRLSALFERTAGVLRIELSFKCSDPNVFSSLSSARAIDDTLLSRLNPLLALATRRGIDVALYPHSFYPLETPAHAARLVHRAAHPRLSYLFATSHVYALSTPVETLAQLISCVSEISSFNVCGCRRSAPGPRAKCAHFPLDEGDLALAPLFCALNAGAYVGDVIVQGHGWRGDLPAMLRRCIEQVSEHV